MMEAEPFMAAVLSWDQTRSASKPMPQERVERVVREAYAEVEHRLAIGPLHITTKSGLLIAYRSG